MHVASLMQHEAEVRSVMQSLLSSDGSLASLDPSDLNLDAPPSSL